MWNSIRFSVMDRWPFSRPELRIAIVYVLFASIWIICSDMALERMIGHKVNSVSAQTAKGLNFVITTGLLLFFVLRRAYGGWRTSEERRMETIQAAREGYRKLSSKLQTMREEERTSISREIHDELGQMLTGIKLQLRLIENQLADREDRSLNSVIDQLVDASSMIDDSIVSVRRISSGLRPTALDDLGLAVALEEESEHFTRKTGIPCHLLINDMAAPLRPELETTAFRIFQESLTNVARHARASRVDAACSIQNEVLKLTVRDDGVGISPEVTTDRNSLGLIGMEERASDSGGSFQLESSVGRGTTVTLVIPLAAQNPAAIMPCQ